VAIYTSGMICQLALEDTDHSLSLIKLIDRVMVDFPEGVPADQLVVAWPLSCAAVLVFKSEGPEQFQVSFTAVAPDGHRTTPISFPVNLTGGGGGFSMRLALNIDARSLGLWWFEVAVRSTVVLRLPLEIARNPANPTESSSQDERDRP
jgi:hypothetical protein